MLENEILSKPEVEVLLVEDNPENREVITFFIRNICNVETALTGPEAVQMARAKKYGIVLMDINLGLGMNGIEATRQIRQLPGYENTPIIAVTAYAMAGDRERFLDAGCTHYISKPFTKRQLVELISVALPEPKPE